jgi:hypothetical protein
MRVFRWWGNNACPAGIKPKNPKDWGQSLEVVVLLKQCPASEDPKLDIVRLTRFGFAGVSAFR